MRATLLLALLCVLMTPAFASLAPPPPPPPGWEQRVTPGFNPSLESIVIRLSRYEQVKPEELRQLWEGWGPDATDALLKLERDPAWKDFRYSTFNLLASSPLPETGKRLEEEVRRLAAAADSKENLDLFQGLFGTYSRQSPDAAYALAKELAKSPIVEVARTAVYHLMRKHTREGLDTAREAIAGLPPDEQKNFQQSLEHAEGYVRANEPMSATPEKDRRG